MKTKNIMLAVSLVATACLLNISGCSPEETPKETPVLELGTTHLDVPFDGGSFVIDYTLENPSEGQTVKAECPVEWISGFDYSTDGKISFTAARNPEEKDRETVISVSYPGIEGSKQVTVLQGHEEREIPVPDPEIKLEMTSLDIPEEGGEYSVKYEIINPVEGIEMKVSTASDWIENLVCRDNVLTFRAAANEGEARNGEISLKYKDAAAALAISQAAMTPQETPPFVISVKDITETEAKYSVIPEDKEMRYLCFALTAEEIEEKGLQDDEALWQNDLAFLKADAETYGDTVEGSVNIYSYTGDMIDQKIGGLIPGEAIVLYAYGVSATGDEATRLTDIVRYNLTTPSVEMSDVKFDITYTTEGTHVIFQVTPRNGYEGHYFTDLVYDIPELEEASATAIETWYLNLSLYASFGYAIEDILTSIARSGEQTVEYALEEGREYFFFAGSLNEKALINSELSYLKISLPAETAAASSAPGMQNRPVRSRALKAVR